MSDHNLNIDEPFNQPLDQEQMQKLTDRIFQSGMTSNEAAELPIMVSLKETDPEIHDIIIERIDQQSTPKKTPLLFGPEVFQEIFDGVSQSTVAKCQQNENNHLDIGAEDFESGTLTKEGADKFHVELKRQLEEAAEKKQVHHQCEILFKGFDLEDDVFFDDRTDEEIELGIEEMYLGALTMSDTKEIPVNKDNINTYCFHSWLSYLQSRLSEIGYLSTEMTEKLDRLKQSCSELSKMSEPNLQTKNEALADFVKRNKLEQCSPEELGTCLVNGFLKEQLAIARNFTDPSFFQKVISPYVERWVSHLDAILDGGTFDDGLPSDVSELYTMSQLYRNGDRKYDNNINVSIANILGKMFDEDVVLALDNSKAFDYYDKLIEYKDLSGAIANDKTSSDGSSLYLHLENVFSGGELRINRPYKKNMITEVQWYNECPHSDFYFFDRDYDLPKATQPIEISFSEQTWAMLKNDCNVLTERVQNNLVNYIIPILERLMIILADKYTDYVKRIDELTQLDYCSKRAIQFITTYTLNEVVRVSLNSVLSATYALSKNTNRLAWIVNPNQDDKDEAVKEVF